VIGLREQGEIVRSENGMIAWGWIETQELERSTGFKRMWRLLRRLRSSSSSSSSSGGGKSMHTQSQADQG